MQYNNIVEFYNDYHKSAPDNGLNKYNFNAPNIGLYILIICAVLDVLLFLTA
jgi:hypothetical protein